MKVLLLTPVADDDITYLPDLATSIAHSRDLPPEVDLYWHVQGDTTDPATIDRILTATNGTGTLNSTAINGRPCGPGITRSIGLATHHATTDVVVTIDADDVFTPTGLADLLRPLLEHPDVAWVGGGNTRFTELHKPATGFYPPGGHLNELIEPGQLARVWRDTGVFPFAAGTIAYRTGAILTVGGWPGTPTSQDAALLLTISDQYPGWAIPHAVFAYRTRPGQLTGTDAHAQLRSASHVFMNARSAHEHPTAAL